MAEKQGSGWMGRSVSRTDAKNLLDSRLQTPDSRNQTPHSIWIVYLSAFRPMKGVIVCPSARALQFHLACSVCRSIPHNLTNRQSRLMALESGLHAKLHAFNQTRSSFGKLFNAPADNEFCALSSIITPKNYRDWDRAGYILGLNPSRILRRLSWQTAGNWLRGAGVFIRKVASGRGSSCWDLRNTRLV